MCNRYAVHIYSKHVGNVGFCGLKMDLFCFEHVLFVCANSNKSFLWRAVEPMSSVRLR